MKVFVIFILSYLEVCIAGAMPAFIANFLDMPENLEVWNETTAQVYLNELVEKHGAKVRQEFDQITEKDRVQFKEKLFRDKFTQSDKLWHVGDATLTEFNESVFGSVLGKLKKTLPSWVPLDNLQEYGIYFFSISDTDIFEGLEEELWLFHCFYNLYGPLVNKKDPNVK